MSTWDANERGYFGAFGGCFVPETLSPAVDELKRAWQESRSDPSFIAELDELLRDYVGRPTPLYEAKRLSREVGGARILLKQEHLAHTGSHKLNNALGQVLLARRMGKTRIIAETGAGQHGVATATACALMDMECHVYMGAEDVRRQRPNAQRMALLGASLVSVESGSQTLKDAINEAIRDWVTNVENTHYVIGSVVGPHPYPQMVRAFQAVIGREAREQMMRQCGCLPDVVFACVGGGSNAIGMFHGFLDDAEVELVGVEAAGCGLQSGQHAATLSAGREGVLHGAKTILLQDQEGQVTETHSISAGLDYPGVGPEHAHLRECGRVSYLSATDEEALAAMGRLSRTEGIIPALEPSHALARAMDVASGMQSEQLVLINVCGRGDKDLDHVEGRI